MWARWTDRCRGLFSPLRKVRTPYGNTRGNAPPPKGEDQWNRENVQSIEPIKRERELIGELLE